MHSGSPPTQRVDNQPQNNLNLVIRDGKIQSGHLSCYNLTKHFWLVVENMLDVSFTSSISDLYHQSSDVCFFFSDVQHCCSIASCKARHKMHFQ